MKTYAYAAQFEPKQQSEGYMVSFADVPEAITEGDSLSEARAMAADALGVALLTYLQLDRPLPVATVAGRLVTPDPDVAAKIAVIDTFRTAGISQSELARRLGKDEKEVRRLLDPDHRSKMSSLTEALSAMGQRLIVGLAAAE
ncbi:type II toxin-antitoxin system HicB family antitoxin [Rhizobium sp. SL86]|uniref:type II toxin-antitoxin system HicB family antitoxin n=1 Tax=Rhizobium sp. SL86 TaxID=2995148 RepID=UPI0022724CBB|nr:type II toxin-antitoxin system HicB family antitoxin [Rhizobium sp. SL86]MCY1664265.1 type II toxin-antitoxin system HicB family antitoxin [Rhizobium sp. SL86]